MKEKETSIFSLRHGHEIKLPKFKEVAPHAVVITTEQADILIHYNSIIAVVTTKGEVFLGKDWNYSKTTAKIRNNFLGETTKETQKHIDNEDYLIKNI